MWNSLFTLAILPVFFLFTDIHPTHDKLEEVRKPLTVLFERGMDLEALSRIQKDLAEEGIQLNYRYLEFDQEGLTGIDFMVDFKDGVLGSAEKEFLPYNKKEKFGFYRSWKEDADPSFAVGGITEVLK